MWGRGGGSQAVWRAHSTRASPDVRPEPCLRLGRKGREEVVKGEGNGAAKRVYGWANSLDEGSSHAGAYRYE
jgi:hypothetical protein